MEVEAVDDGILASIMVPRAPKALPSEPRSDVLPRTASHLTMSRGAGIHRPGSSGTCRSTGGGTDAADAGSGSAPAAVSSAGRPTAFSPAAGAPHRGGSGVDLASLSGSGPAWQDCPARCRLPAETAPASVRPAVDQAVVQGASTLEPNSQMRRIIASRLQESKQTAPHFYLTVDCEIDALLAAGAQ